MSIDAVLANRQPFHIEVCDVLDGLRLLPDECVQCILTSPPYWLQRNYEVSGQIGQESTYQEYVKALVDVFRESRRVLHKSGVLFLNLGDVYNNFRSSGYPPQTFHDGKARGKRNDFRRGSDGLKEKDMLGLPWRVAFGLQDDGWYLRDDIVWHKINCMPASYRDRTIKAHEYVFLLTKSPKYFYDWLAIAEEAIHAGETITLGAKSMSKGQATAMGRTASGNGKADSYTVVAQKNRRSVWRISLEKFRGAHFATMPKALAELCLKAGTSEKGCCDKCGAPLRRVTERTQLKRHRPNDYIKRTGEEGTGNSCANSVAGVRVETLGWEKSCKCGGGTIPCLVMDIFSGAATTGVVAKRLGLRYIGLELNPEYAAMGAERIQNDTGEKKKPKKRQSKDFAHPKLF